MGMGWGNDTSTRAEGGFCTPQWPVSPSIGHPALDPDLDGSSPGHPALDTQTWMGPALDPQPWTPSPGRFSGPSPGLMRTYNGSTDTCTTPCEKYDALRLCG
ncbi:unnamed protein product [Merluccius merluccius]